MADEQREEGQKAGQGGSAGKGVDSTGDPGRTPDKAEGSEETADESLNPKGKQ